MFPVMYGYSRHRHTDQSPEEEDDDYCYWWLPLPISPTIPQPNGSKDPGTREPWA